MRFTTLISILLFAFAKLQTVKTSGGNVSDAGNWGYKNGHSFKSPSEWKSLPNTTCNGRRQSPIDIKTRNVMYWDFLQPIKVEKIGSVDKLVSIDLHVTSIHMNFNPIWKISFGKTGCLRPVSIHWHWGSDSTKGSEHRINGKQYPIEAHLIAFNCELYSSPNDALIKPSGVHVIGFFYEIGANNTVINQVIDSLGPILENQNTSVLVNEIDPKQFLPLDLVKYYRYEGSLTAPPCTENVIWTLLKDVQYISEEQLSYLRRLKFGAPEVGLMENNFRPIINTNGDADHVLRIVFSSFNNGIRVISNSSLMLLLLSTAVFYNP